MHIYMYIYIFTVAIPFMVFVQYSIPERGQYYAMITACIPMCGINKNTHGIYIAAHLARSVNSAKKSMAFSTRSSSA